MLDLGLIFSTFVVVFFAELGDKTQLVAFSMTSTTKNSVLIFLASSLALSLSAVLAALLGGVAANLLPSFTAYVSAALFLAFGVYILASREAPRIKECFLKTISLENTLLHILPRLLKKLGRDDYRLVDILRQERSHSEIFKVLLKEKKLFKDDINEAEPLEKFLDKLDLKKDLLKLPPRQALEEIIAWEEAGKRVFSFILEHLDRETHHDEASLQRLLQSLIAEERQHIRFYQEICEELADERQ